MPATEQSSLSKLKGNNAYSSLAIRENNAGSAQQSVSSGPRNKMFACIALVVVVVGVIVIIALFNGTESDQEHTVTLTSFSSYPGYDGDIAVSGTVYLDFESTHVTIDYYDLQADAACINGPTDGVDNSCGIHIHEGSTCDDADEVGGHYYNAELIAEDPWVYEAYYTPGNGTLFEFEYGHDFTTTEGRAFVVHDIDGTRIACELIYAEEIVDVAVNGEYPGYAGDLSINGDVTLNFQNTQVTIVYDLTGQDPTCADGPINGTANSCGIHIHEGTSCDADEDVGGHYFSGDEDPWQYDAFYTDATGELVVEYGYSWDTTEGRAFVVHDVDGTRVTCDLINF